MARRLLIVLAVLALLAVAAVILLALLSDRQQVIAYATGLLHEKTGVTLEVNGDAQLSLLPVMRVSLHDIAITLPERPQPDVHARSLDIQIQLLPLLSGDLKAGSVVLDGLVVRRESNPTPADNVPQQGATAQAHPAATFVIDLSHITVTDAQVTLLETDTTTRLNLRQLQASAYYNSRLASPELETSGTATGLDIVLAKRAEDATDVISGTVDLDWQLGTSGNDRAALLASLNGPITLSTASLVLHNTSVEHILCQTIALANQETLSASFNVDTRFKPLTARILLADGRAVLQPLQATLPGVAITGEGSLDLLSDVFTAQFVARVSSELEQLDHACRVSKRLMALDWPIACTSDNGAEPANWCSVDTTQILQSLMIDEGMEKLEKKANKFLNKLFNRDS
jgi:uncharacterized protein involved in outer membrane biogenesis